MNSDSDEDLYDILINIDTICNQKPIDSINIDSCNCPICQNYTNDWKSKRTLERDRIKQLKEIKVVDTIKPTISISQFIKEHPEMMERLRKNNKKQKTNETLNILNLRLLCDRSTQ